MILITDGGSTKCDWIAINKNGEQAVEKIRTKGLNPAIIEETKLEKIVKKKKALRKIALEIFNSNPWLGAIFYLSTSSINAYWNMNQKYA